MVEFKFNVGDVVTIIPDIKAGDDYLVYVNEDMVSEHDNKYVINRAYEYQGFACYKLEGNEWDWTEDLFVETNERGDKKMETKEMVQFPEINVPERDDTEYIERCIELEKDLYETYSCCSDDDIPYPYKEENVRKANEFSNKKKAKLNALFSRHPKWDNKTHSIVFDIELERKIDKNVVSNFIDWIKLQYYNIIPTISIGLFTYADIKNAAEKMLRIKTAYEQLYNSEKQTSIIAGYKYDEAMSEYELWQSRLVHVVDHGCRITDGYGTGKYVSAENKNLYNDVCRLLNALLEPDCLSQFVTEEYASYCTKFENNTGIKLNAPVGKKVSRVIGTLCKAIKVNEIKNIRKTVTDREYDDGYNRRYAEFADAINPITFKQKTVIATDRIAFLTASFGNGWASCYTIDKYNTRDNEGHDYQGCYSGGTTSYGSDETTFVFYTISNTWTGDPALADKYNRCFFSLGEGKIIQSRNYPDGRDNGDTSLAKQFREIVQKIVAECYDISNLWINRKGIDECNSVITYKGAGYHDHINYGDCNVSYWKGRDEHSVLNTNRIILGSPTICPNCGGTAEYDETVLCYACSIEGSGVRTCACCDTEGDEDCMYEINGEWYCEDCVFYCEYHEQYEPGDSVYIEGYGNVCEEALEWSDQFHCCEHCGEWYYENGDTIETENGNYYCCDECAENDGYLYCVDVCEWVYKDDAYKCEECGEYVTSDNYDFEHDMCVECWNDAKEDAEETVA